MLLLHGTRLLTLLLHGRRLLMLLLHGRRLLTLLLHGRRLLTLQQWRRKAFACPSVPPPNHSLVHLSNLQRVVVALDVAAGRVECLLLKEPAPQAQMVSQSVSQSVSQQG